MKVKILITLVLTLSGLHLSSCSSKAMVQSGNVAPVEIAIDDSAQDIYAVYSVILASKEVAVVSDRTNTGALADSFVDNLETEISQETIDAYKEANKAKGDLTKVIPSQGKVTLISDADSETIFKNRSNGWNEFYRRYKDARGIFTFSQVGFNRDRTECVVSVGFGCGMLCGEGNVYILDKREGRWVIRLTKGLWVS